MTDPHGPQVAGQPAADRLMAALDYRLSPGTQRLTRDQVAVVLHALADHTAIQAALAYRVDPSSPWPQATSMGRWYHDVGDQLGNSPISASGVDYARLSVGPFAPVEREPMDLGEPRPKPHAFIQWKGTEACLDFICTCGRSRHYDEMFLYSITCDCGLVWWMPSQLAPTLEVPEWARTDGP